MRSAMLQINEYDDDDDDAKYWIHLQQVLAFLDFRPP